MRSQRQLISAIAIALLLSFAGTDARGAKLASPKSAAPSSGELHTLQKAHALLARADHDYHGHRIRAMHAIEEACKELGGDARGEDAGGEPQGESDSQLKAAQSLLNTARGEAGSGKRERVVHHIDHAIQELQVALSIK